MSQIFKAIAPLRQFLDSQDAVGFVPTMGALHRGHLSLIARAKRENSCMVVSIFVNPLQFGAGEDLDRYPRPLERDLQLCQDAGVDAIFVPNVSELLGTGAQLTAVVPPPAMTDILCGRSRPGHFTGVATIVTKLLHIVQPRRVYFGQKDGQQLAILRRVISDLNFPVQVIGCPTVRESSGLALSSRNQYLDPEQSATAATLYRSLEQAAHAFVLGVRDRETLLEKVRDCLAQAPTIAVEYVELVNARSLQPLKCIEVGSDGNNTNTEAMLAIAARIGNTRLIDNMLLQSHKPIIAIDGPAGAGKSTVARQVAQQLGLLYLDTGAMYRAITLAVLQAGIDPADEASVGLVANRARIEIVPSPFADVPPKIYLDDRDVTWDIRSVAVTERVAAISTQSAVRQALVKQQQELGKFGGLVMEGRDIGTKVFPKAEVKVFLTASAQERAHRRQKDLVARGESVTDLQSIEQSIQQRDAIDSNRAISPLTKADDAIEVNTDGLSVEAVVGIIVDLYHERQLVTAKT
ncbi:bifunctional pantoate--beta-alanine ligase/(d)CMP kinase [Pseudanabaena sp. PCC 6802]|uniref:bifunctional pantoate--beta-alanine ligase/(d)CMP kinase n=1 Tax=Pseudanabaena sp. PCC 6802 TaxID=118173 RepID=UPI00034503FE|nr:bifunctional pantoate--beta-alanine ligase/(d)CMP kinase [Pseudanabaena sp. PCC 6802]